jgi:hypothetical protein
MSSINTRVSIVAISGELFRIMLLSGLDDRGLILTNVLAAICERSVPPGTLQHSGGMEEEAAGLNSFLYL